MERKYWEWPESNWVNPDIDWEKAKFITAGIDVGAISTQVVIMADGELYAFSNTRTGLDSTDSAYKGIGLALSGTNLTIGDIDYCIGTGYGRVNVPIAQKCITEITCHARGANFFYGPTVRTVLDIGGQDSKVIRIDEHGKVLKFLMNDKCAAGTGRGMEVFADLIGVPVWEIGTRSFQVQKEPPMISSTCVVFAKSEAIDLLEEGWAENSVIAAYCSAMAHRIVGILKRLGLESDFCITGGIAKNEGIVKRIEREVGIKTMERKWYRSSYAKKNYPFDTQIIGAAGAALLAYELLQKDKDKNTG